MLSGDNGLLKRAGDARDDTVVGQEKEQVELAYISAAVKKLGDNVTKDELQIELNSSVGTNKTDVEPNRDGTLNVYFTDTEHNYNVDNGIVTKVDSADPIVTKTLAEQITATNYGDYIHYNVDLNGDGNTTNDWRVFYKNDSGNVFIIAADFLNNSLLPSETGFRAVDGSNYNTKTHEIVENTCIPYIDYRSISLNSSTKSKFMSTFEGEYLDIPTLLLNSSAWSSFATGVPGAEAIGSPTLELFISSWNEKGYTTRYLSNNEYGVGLTDENGNDIGLDNYDDTTNPEFQDNLYFLPRKGDAKSFWIASNSSFGSLWCEEDDFGYLGLPSSVDNNNQLALRPVVCLPSTTTGSKDTNDIWTID